MFAEERQQRIAERARTEGRVDVAALASDFEVTTETIRRDLTALERQGVVKKVHGGAIPLERIGFEPTVAARDTVQTAAKERIAAAPAAKPRLTVLIVGGKVRERTMAAVDDWALRALAETFVDVAFIGANG